MVEISQIFRVSSLTFALVVMGLLPTASLRAQSISDTAIADQLLAGMSQKGLPEAAARYCHARVGLASDLGAKTRWTQRLMESLDQAALRGIATSAQPWKAADDAYAQFEAEFPNAPRAPWLRWQLIRGELLETQAQLATYLAAPGRKDLEEQLLKNVREIVRKSDELTDEIALLRPIAARRSVNDTENPSAEDLARLLVDTTLIRIEALVIRSRTYPEGSRDQISAASQVVTLVDEVFQKTERSWGSRNKLLIARSYGWLKTGRVNEAINQLGSLAKSGGDDSSRATAGSILAEHFISVAEPEKAKIALQWIPEQQPQSALVRLQLLVAEVATAGATADARKIEGLLAEIKKIEQQFGRYWRNRAEAIVASQIADVEIQGSSDVPFDLIATEARQLLAAGDAAAATAKLVEGSKKEQSAGRVDNALRLAGQASALFQREGQWDRAIDVVVTLASENPESEVASAVFFNALLSQAQALRENTKSVEARTKYEQLLSQQILNWPNSPEADQAQQWLTTWLSAMRRQTELCRIISERLVRANPNIAYEQLPTWYLQIAQIFPPSARIDFFNRFLSEHPPSELKEPLASSVSQLNTLLNWESFNQASAAAALFKLTDATTEPGNRVIGPNQSVGNVTIQLLAEYVLAIVANDRDRAKRLTEKFAAVELSQEVLLAATENLVAAIDASADREFWAAILPFSNTWRDALLGSARGSDQILALRLQLLRDRDETVRFGLLRQLSDLQGANNKNANILLKASEMLADARRLEESTRIAKRLTVGAKRGSLLSLSAKWRLIKNLQLSGEIDQSQKLLATTMATVTFPNEYWKTRFTNLRNELGK